MSSFTTLIRPQELARLPPSALVCDCSFDLGDPAAGRRTYGAAHIPGAVYLSLDDVLSGDKTGRNGRHPLPDRECFAARMAGLGVSGGTQVVAYDAGDGMYAARLWFLMRWIGHDSVAVLDGGLAAWRAARLPVDTLAPAARLPGDLAAWPSLVPILDYDSLRGATADGSRLVVDARAPDRFRGENETLDPIGGHIPGARNRFFRDNLDEGVFKAPDRLREEFEAVLAGRPAEDMVAQCGSGVTACHNLLAMAVAGMPGAALYPGSWSEWSSRPGSPVARGPA